MAGGNTLLVILNREASAFPGGDILSINETIEALRQFDIEATLMQGWWKPRDIESFDRAVVYHSNFTWSRYNFEGVSKSGVPWYSRPMFYPTENLGLNYPQIREFLSSARALVPQSWREWDELQQLTGLAHDRVEAIPNGTSERFHALNAGTARRGVLTVAAREGGKNEKLVEQACAKLNLPFKTITGVSPHLMPLIYRQFRVFVNASDSERMSRTVGEALCSGCRVLSPVGNRGNEWYGHRLAVIDPELDFSAVLHNAYHAPTWDFEPNERARELTWTKTAEKMAEIYRRI